MIGNIHTQNQRELREAVSGLVEDLGQSPAAVADRLAADHVKGVPGSAQECAVARYLRAIVGSDSRVKEVLVSDTHVRVLRPGLRPAVMVSLPVAVTAFIRAFDSGCFSAVVEPAPARRSHRIVSFDN